MGLEHAHHSALSVFTLFQNSLSVHKQQFLFVFEEEFEEYPPSCCIFHLHKVGLCLNSLRCSVSSIEIAEGNKRVRDKGLIIVLGQQWWGLVP